MADAPSPSITVPHTPVNKAKPSSAASVLAPQTPRIPRCPWMKDPSSEIPVAKAGKVSYSAKGSKY